MMLLQKVKIDALVLTKNEGMGKGVIIKLIGPEQGVPWDSAAHLWWKKRCGFPSPFCPPVPTTIRRWFSPGHTLEQPQESSKLHWLVTAPEEPLCWQGSPEHSKCTPDTSIYLQHLPYTWEVWAGLAKSQLSQLCVTHGFLHARRSPSCPFRIGMKG